MCPECGGTVISMSGPDAPRGSCEYVCDNESCSREVITR